MGEDEREVGSPVADERTPEQIEADIERTRREMGDTVAAVAEKADVKAQAKTKVDEARARLTEKKDEMLHRTRAAAPDSAGEGAGKLATVARDNQRALAIGGAAVVVFLLGRRSAR
jgi:chromosome segregation ATPase